LRSRQKLLYLADGTGSPKGRLRIGHEMAAETIQFGEFADRRTRRRNCPDCCLWMWRLTAGDGHDLIQMCVRVM
jgi:ribosomal protein L20